jgi:hypothetical protein
MPKINNFGLGPGQIPLRSKTVNLTAADILAISTTPFELVPAPGAGAIVALQSIVLVYHFGTHAFEPNVVASLKVVYAGGATDLTSDVIAGSFITGSQSSFAFAPGRNGSGVTILPGSDNTAIQLTGADFHGGPIVTSTLGAGGLGYAVNDTGTLQDGNFDASYKVLTVGAGGAVLTYSITAPGSGYVVANGVATAPGGAQPGAGAGLTVNITAVQNGDGTLKVVTYYQIVPVP